MTASSQQLQEWLHAKEGEHLEFKEAKNNFHFEKLVKYCAALANEGGGSIVLGVTDTRPRQVVGSQVFTDLERTGEETLATLNPPDFLILGLIASGERLPVELQPHLPRLLELGILDRTGRGKPVLAKRLYSSAKGVSAKTAEREAAGQRNRTALRDHITKHAGCSLQEIMASFPELTRNQVQSYLKQLRSEELIHPSGPTKSARWFPGLLSNATGGDQV